MFRKMVCLSNKNSVFYDCVQHFPQNDVIDAGINCKYEVAKMLVGTNHIKLIWPFFTKNVMNADSEFGCVRS